LYAWWNLEWISLLMEPTILILLHCTKPAPKEGESYVSTYGRMTARIDRDDYISDKQFEHACHELRKSNQYLLFMKEDFPTAVAMSFYKRKAERYSITSGKRSQLFFSCIFSQMITCGMLCCMLWAVVTNESGSYYTSTAKNWPLFGCKFLSAIALHFMLYPEVADGMTIMKFSIYSFDQFVSHFAAF
jgi:hypothetical protein